MKKYSLLFLVFFAFFLIANLPANLFASSVRQLNLNIGTLEGSIWQGHTYNPKLGKIDWDFSPLGLLQAKLAWRVHIEQTTQQALEFDIGINIFKQLQLSNATGTLSSTTLKTFAVLPDNIASFMVQIDNLDASWDADSFSTRPNSLQGLVQVKNLNILGEHLGNYQLHINSENQQLVAAITETNANLKTHLKATLSLSNLLNVEGDIETSDQNMRALLNSMGIKNKIVFKHQL